MSHPRVRVRIEFDSTRWLGPGKVWLLEAVDRTGSLTGAASECGMSYKRAWELLRAANDLLGTPLVELTKGGRGGGGGARITAAGREVIAAYWSTERKSTAIANDAFAPIQDRYPRSPDPASKARKTAAGRRRKTPGSRKRATRRQ